MENLFLMTFKKYFPEFDVEVKSIYEKIYINIENLIESTITVFRGNASIEELIVREDSFYHDKEKGIQMDMLYTIHSIVCTLIVNRHQFEIETISSEIPCLKTYMSRVYRTYSYSDKIIINDLLTEQSSKFMYLEVEQNIAKSCDRIGFNVSYYPIQTTLSNYRYFALMGVVIPFEPCLQNSRVLLRCVGIVPNELYNGILLEVIIRGNVSKEECVATIDDYFDSLQQYMVSCIPMFKNFDSYLVDKYNLVQKGWFGEISSMSGIPLHFLNKYKDELKPYVLEIIKDEYCQLDYILANKRLVSKNNLWACVLKDNRNMTRQFLIKFISKCPNALIYHIELLENGDEVLFKKYRRKIDWDEFVRNFRGTRLCMVTILDASKKYISCSDRFRLLSIQQQFAEENKVLPS